VEFSQRGTAGYGAEIVGLLIGAGMAALLASPARWAVSVGASALTVGGVVWLLLAAATAAAFRLWSGEPRSARDYGRLLTVATWLAPVALFAAAGSPFAAAAVVGLGAAATRLWKRQDENPIGEPEAELFGRITAPRGGLGRFRMQAASGLAYGACVLAFLERPLPALPLAFAAATLAFWSSSSASERPSRLRPVLMTALAVCLLFFGLMPEKLGVGSWGWGRRAETAEAAEAVGAEESDRSSGQYSSVILTTVPPLEAEREAVRAPVFGLGRSRRSQTVIPFSGEYWFFHWPRSGPGDNASVRVGDPKISGFRSTDSDPILMQARQPLDPPLDLSCCNAIDVVLASREPRPGLFAVELVSGADSFRRAELGGAVAGRGDGEVQRRSTARGAVRRSVAAAARGGRTADRPFPPGRLTERKQREGVGRAFRAGSVSDAP